MQFFETTNRWQLAKSLRSRTLANGEFLQLVQDPIFGQPAWVLHRPNSRSAAESLPLSLSPKPHPGVLAAFEGFAAGDGFSFVFPSMSAVTLADAIASLEKDGADPTVTLGKRMLDAIRANLLEGSERSDSRTWNQENGRLVADLCLQIVRLAMYLETQGAGAVSLRVSRILLTPFGRVLFWAVPEAAPASALPLGGAGEIVAKLVSFAGESSDSPLDAIGYSANPKYSQDRYASLAELAADLERYLEGSPVHARRPGAVLCFARHWTARPERVAAAFLVLAAAAVATVWAMMPAAQESIVPTPIRQSIPAAPEKEKIPATTPPKMENPKAQTARRGGMAAAWNSTSTSSASPR